MKYLILVCAVFCGCSNPYGPEPPKYNGPTYKVTKIGVAKSNFTKDNVYKIEVDGKFYLCTYDFRSYLHIGPEVKE